MPRLRTRGVLPPDVRRVHAFKGGGLRSGVRRRRFARTAGIDRERCLNLMANLCERIPKGTESVLEEEIARGIPDIGELAERLLPKVRAHCDRTLQML